MDIKKAGIIGSGTMGGGIAMCFANAGIPVHIIDQDEENLKIVDEKITAKEKEIMTI